MRNELEYPIKYAVLELKEQGGFLAGYEDITQGFIVSKCYVVGSEIKYYSNGKYDITYKVVFPFKNISSFKLSLNRGTSYDCYETIPLYDASGDPYPIDIVTSLFDNYEEAKEISLLKNEKMEENLILKISLLDENWKEKYEKLKQDYRNGKTLVEPKMYAMKRADIKNLIRENIFS